PRQLKSLEPLEKTARSNFTDVGSRVSAPLLDRPVERPYKRSSRVRRRVLLRERRPFMERSRFMGPLVAALALSLLPGCEKKPSIDWSAKENFFASEVVGKNPDDSVRLEFHSLIDAPADAI